MGEPLLDEIGRWSEIKLEIIREYAKPYSTILAKYPKLFHLYIDGFAGAGMHISKRTKRKIAGSSLNVTGVQPPFREYHLIELNSRKVALLRSLFAKNPAVVVHHGDCNLLLPDFLRANVQYAQFRRAFCLLDPYGLHVDWRVIESAGQLGTIDMLLNFPMMDMNMNVLWNDPAAVSNEQSARMTRFWGDDSWKRAGYEQEAGLFGAMARKSQNQAIVDAFRDRLKSAAGFKFVPDALPMKNSTGAIVYYLVFASPKSAAYKIIGDIFRKWRRKMQEE
jgi:three-Cys-motif partner protein